MQPPSLPLARRIDELGDRFEAACQSGMTARLEEYVDRVPAPDRAAALAALLAVELEVRRRSGAVPRAAEYQARFPDLANVVEGVFAQAATLDTSVLGDAGTLPLERPLVPAAQPPLARIGRFVVIGQLGAGAFGEVYRCHDPELDRDVAIKVPRKGTLETEADVQRFLREGKAAATMQHPNICPVHEVGTADGRPYIVMALVPGKSLAEHINQRIDPLPEHQAATIVRKLATALDFAHSRGIIHRDLKPANIMVLADGDRKDVVVMDFGLARSPRRDAAQLTQTGMLMGTPAYMSPEQARGDQRTISPRSDIYSLGVIMYELLTRRRPFSGSVAEVLGKVLHVQPEPPSQHRPGLNSRLESICLQAMAKQPEQRFASMRELADALAPAAWKPAAAATSTAPTAAISTVPAAAAAAAPAESLGWTDELKTLGPVPAVRQRVARQRTQQVGQLIAAAVLGLALLCGIVIYVATNEGTVQITLSDPSAQVEVKVDGETIQISGLDDPLTLRAGPHGLVVSGKNYETVSKSFTVKRGDNPVLQVELVAKATPLPPPSKQLVEKLVPSLVFVKVAGDSRMPIGVVTDLGVCTVMPGTFQDVELTTLDGKRKFAGTVVSRDPYPFCWIESKELDLSPLKRAETGLKPTPQDAVFFMVYGKTWQAHAGQVPANGVFTTSLEFGPRPGEVVASAPVFSQDGTCLGFVARQDREKPIETYELRRFAWQHTAAAPNATPPMPPAAEVAAQTTPPVLAASEPTQAGALQNKWAKDLGISISSKNSIGISLVLVPPGEFLMGASAEEPERFHRGSKQHRVRLTKPYLIGATEVTQGQWQAVMGTTPWKGGDMVREGADYPATYIKWDDAIAFCHALSVRERRICRLPTEAEWEYACRAGTQTVFSFGDDESRLGDYGWVRHNANDLPGLVARKLPNPWGLHDVHGGVWEWCNDWYADYPGTDVVDPTGPAQGEERVLRGGAFWSADYGDHRSAKRAPQWPGITSPEYGLRIVVEIAGPDAAVPAVANQDNGVPPVLPEAEAIRSQFTTEVAKIVRDEQAARTSAGNKSINAILRARPSNIEKLKETVPAKLEVDLAKLRVEAERKIDAARKKALADFATLRNKLAAANNSVGATGVDKLVQEITESNPLVDLASLTNSVGMQLAWTPPGTFLMGSPKDEVNRGDDEEQHEVAITRAFYIGVHEVTQGQYEKVIGKNPTAFKEGNGGGANHPVDSVSWQDAVDFCMRLSELPAEKAAGRIYRLPTEAEWEYACRAGTTTPYNDGDPARRRMLVTRSFLGETAAVGSQKPNRFGLYDMHGNVQEWCADWYGPYPTGRQVDPTGPATGMGRVIRGGWHEDGRNEVGSAERAELAPVFPIDDMGFRVVCNVIAKEAGILVPTPQSADSDRAVAQWVYSVGGRVGTDDQEYPTLADLPAGPLRITVVSLGFTQVTDADLARLGPLTQLNKLHLHGCNIGVEGMAHLAAHKQLKWLSLWDTNVGDAGMKHLAQLTDLDYVLLNGSRVTGAGLAQLSGLAKLKDLHLEGLSGVTGDGLRHLGGLRQLEYLTLKQTSIDDQGLVHLAGLTNLRTLNLSETSTGDTGLAAIKPLKNLRLLYLTGTKITDAGLRHCEVLVNLRELNLDHTSASPAGVQTLQKALPACKITAVKP